jgi:hypothetical protein
MLRVHRQIAELQPVVIVPIDFVAQDEIAHVSDDGPASHLVYLFNRESKADLESARKTASGFENRMKLFSRSWLWCSQVLGSLTEFGALCIGGSLSKFGALKKLGSLALCGALSSHGFSQLAPIA